MLRTLGRAGLADLVDSRVALARYVADGLREIGYTVLNQVLARADTPQQTTRLREHVQRSGESWFGPTIWDGEPAFRISVSSRRTERHHVDALLDLLRSVGP